MRPYEYLEKLGVLNENFLGAHSLLFSENEKEILEKRGIKVCHCPFSNCGKSSASHAGIVEKVLQLRLGRMGQLTED